MHVCHCTHSRSGQGHHGSVLRSLTVTSSSLCNLFLSQPHFLAVCDFVALLLTCCLEMFWPTFLAITICPFNVLYNSSLNMINFASWCFPMTSTVLLELIVSEQWSRHSPDNEFMQLLVCRLNQSAKKHVMSIAVLIGSEGEYFFPFVDPVIKNVLM